MNNFLLWLSGEYAHISQRMRSDSGGFTLLHLSVILVVASILMLAALPGGDRSGTAAKMIESEQKIKDRVESAVRGFMVVNNRRPCPADPALALSDSNFGREKYDQNSGTCAGLPMMTTGAVAGMIPTRTLGLPDSDALDAWSRRYTYVADTQAVNAAQCAASFTGNLAVRATKDGKILAGAMAVYISHGADGFGAFPAKGSSVQERMNNNNSDPDTMLNAMVDANFNLDFRREFVKKERTATFDDVVVYATTCTLSRANMAQ